MKMLKKLMSAILAVSMVASGAMYAGAAEVSEIYNKTYIEKFEDAEKVFGDDGIFRAVQNVTEDSVKVSVSNQGNEYLQVSSINNSDVIVGTKKGTFKHDVTVVDMTVSATLGTQAFPLIRLVNSGAKMDTGNGLFRFVNSNKSIRSYNQASGSYDAVSVSNGWINVRIILDSVNKTITTSFNGSQVKAVSQMTNAWDNKNVQIYFQAAAGSVLNIGEIFVCDGFHMEDVYMAHDFEYSTDVNKQVGNGFFYNINKTANPTVVYDAEAGNTYLDITSATGNTIHTAWTIDNTTKPVVVELDMKADTKTGSLVSLKRNSNKAVTNLFTVNEIIADGTFHRYKAIFSPVANGYKFAMFIDNNYKGSPTKTGTYSGNDLRLEITAGAEATGVAIDNLKIAYAQSPVLVSDLRDATDVAIDTPVELISNTQINASTASKATITANGVPVAYTASSNGNKNSYIYNIEGGLKKGTTYVITTGAAGVRDLFDQFYNDTITFTTVPEDIEAGFEFTINGQASADNKFKAGDALNATFNVKSNTEDGINAYGYIAYYSADDTLFNVQIIDLSVEGKGSDSDVLNIESIPAEVESIKIMLWKTDVTPLGDFVELVK